MSYSTFSKRILVTGGSGFIGCWVVDQLVNTYPNYLIVNYDVLTYAGNEENNSHLHQASNYCFEKGDILDATNLTAVFSKYEITDVIHLAAESHVDRSISNPLAFVQTNVLGTVTLLNASLKHWGEHCNRAEHLFYHVSTDEVYGSLGADGLFTETTPYDPRSPYSASKASSDHFVRAYHETYGLPVVISNCSNNFGPKQYPEKLLPVTIRKIAANQKIPVYGKGENIRDWLWVKDHADAIITLFHKANAGTTYNIGGNNEWTNLDLVKLVCKLCDHQLGRAEGTSEQLIEFVADRKGHDFRYAIDASKIKEDFGWTPTTNFEKLLNETIQYYL